MNINENRTQTLYNYDKVKDLKKKATIWTAHSFLAVSYTHLDLYKRQILSNQLLFLILQI